MFDWLFKKKKIKIEFYSEIEELLYTNAPDKGTDIINNFMTRFKIVKNNNPMAPDISRCPGIVTYMNQGYIIRAWADIEITATPDGKNFKYKTSAAKKSLMKDEVNKELLQARIEDISAFGKETMYDIMPRDDTCEYVLKYNTPWSVKMPKGYGMLLVPIFYDNEQRFTTIPGVLLTEAWEKINVFLFLHKLGETVSIKEGTPLCKIIPIKLEQYEVEHRFINKQDIIKANVATLLMRASSSYTWKKVIKLCREKFFK